MALDSRDIAWVSAGTALVMIITRALGSSTAGSSEGRTSSRRHLRGRQPQALACVIVATFALAGSYVPLRISNIFTPVRVSPAEEDAGLDISGFGEEAYAVEADEPRSAIE